VIPPGLCHCGCGQRTPIAQKTSRRDGHVIGQPIRFVSGHNARLPRLPRRPACPPCKCGCGLPAPRRHLAGERYKQRDYIIGHEPDTGPLFVEAAAEIVMAVHDGGPDEFRDHLADALALDTPDGVTAVEALVAALAALVDPDTRTATVRPITAYLQVLRDTSAGAA
jgi:hypothetical protein